MRDTCREHHGLAALGETVPVAYDVANELDLVHALGKLPLDIIALPRVHAFQVWLARCKYLGADEETLRDQLRHLRPLNQRIEHVAKAPTVTPTRRCRQSDDFRIGVFFDDGLVGARANVMRLVDKHDVGRRQLERLRAEAS